jgi:hypothetical protein
MQPQAPQPGIFDNVQKFLYVIVAICLVVAGIYIGMKFNTPTVEATANSARLKPFTPTPEPEPQPNPGPGPSPQPYPPVPPPKPHPEPKVNFKPTLKLLSALYNPASREIQVKYKVDADTPIPPTRTYSVNFFVEINGKPFTTVSEDDPLHQEDIGFEKLLVLETTGMQAKIKSSQMKVSAQIHYYASDTTSGVAGTPQTIQVT